MASFDMRGQNVDNQFNINHKPVSNKLMDAIQQAKEDMQGTERRSILRKHAILCQLIRKLTDDFPEGLQDDIEIILRQFNDNGL